MNSVCIEVGLMAGLQPGERRILNLHGHSIALFNMDGQLYAVDDRCPHAGASLASGQLDGKLIQCRAHGLRYNIETGEFRPGRQLCLATYPVTVKKDRIFVTIPASATGGTNP